DLGSKKKLERVAAGICAYGLLRGRMGLIGIAIRGRQEHRRQQRDDEVRKDVGGEAFCLGHATRPVRLTVASSLNLGILSSKNSYLQFPWEAPVGNAGVRRSC